MKSGLQEQKMKKYRKYSEEFSKQLYWRVVYANQELTEYEIRIHKNPL